MLTFKFTSSWYFANISVHISPNNKNLDIFLIYSYPGTGLVIALVPAVSLLAGWPLLQALFPTSLLNVLISNQQGAESSDFG